MKKVVAIAVILLLWLLWDRGSSRVEGTDYLTERFWMDRLTDDPREMVNHAFFVADERFGVIARRSSYQLSLDVVRWDLAGDRITLELLQEDRRVEYRVKTWRCAKNEAPNEALPYCMTLTGPEGTRRYFAAEAPDPEMRALVMAQRPR